jgi:hypothetical protein
MATPPMNRPHWTSEFPRPMKISKTRETYPHPTVEQMRQIIQLYAYDNTTAHVIVDTARWKGYSQDEAMVFIAYQALCQMEQAQDALLDHMMYCVKPLQIFVDKKGPDGPK